MGRKRRQEAKDGIAHVWARGNNRRTLFETDADRRLYLTLLALEVRDRGWRCLAYCLMGNHVHLLIKTPRANLGVGMCTLHGDYARTFNQRHGRRNHLFGEPYGAKPILDVDHLRHAAAYVALNPVRAGLAPRPEDWPWSSHAALIGATAAPPWFDAGDLLAAVDLPGEPAFPALVAALVGIHTLAPALHAA